MIQIGSSNGVLICLATDSEPSGYPYGTRLFKVDATTKLGTWLVYTPSGWIRETSPRGPVSHSFEFDSDDLTRVSPLVYSGLVKNLHLVVPAFTNAVTATVTLVDASARVLWTSAAKAKGASYNLEIETEWVDQVVDNTTIWMVTLSGAAGGSGGTVVLIPRYFGI